MSDTNASGSSKHQCVDTDVHDESISRQEDENIRIIVNPSSIPIEKVTSESDTEFLQDLCFGDEEDGDNDLFEHDFNRPRGDSFTVVTDVVK